MRTPYFYTDKPKIQLNTTVSMFHFMRTSNNINIKKGKFLYHFKENFISNLSLLKV